MNPTTGILLKLASTLVFTGMVACIKVLAATVPVGEIVFSRAFFALVPILAFVVWRGRLADAVRTAHLGGHVWRCVVGVSSMACSFAALAYLPLPEQLAIGYAAPLITVVLAALLLGETVRLYRTSAVIVGFLGILVILWPRLEVLRHGLAGSDDVLGAGLALAGAVFSAMAMVAVRRLVATENTQAIVFYLSLISSLLALLSLPLGWVWPTPLEAALLVLSGVLGGLGQILLTESYRHADTSTIAPFEYTTMIWALALGYLLFADVPSLAVLAGAAIVIASGIFIILREHYLGIERARARRVATPQG
jgi:drug/metabolite transporter (DMT)-like permease